jgi:hypothetical protein
MITTVKDISGYTGTIDQTSYDYYRPDISGYTGTIDLLWFPQTRYFKLHGHHRPPMVPTDLIPPFFTVSKVITKLIFNLDRNWKDSLKKFHNVSKKEQTFGQGNATIIKKNGSKKVK